MPACKTDVKLYDDDDDDEWLVNKGFWSLNLSVAR